MAQFKLMQIDEMESIYGGMVKLAAAELGVESFGMQVIDLPTGFDTYPEHDHADEQMEEVYVVLRGSAEFTIDGERVPADATQILLVEPGATRTLKPGPEGVRLLAIGCTRQRPYERHPDFQLPVNA